MAKKNKWTEEKLAAALAQSKATLAIEGMIVSEEEEALVARMLKGEITESEFIELALQLARKEEKSGENERSVH